MSPVVPTFKEEFLISFMSRSEGLSRDDFFKYSKMVLAYFMRNYSSHAMPSIFYARYYHGLRQLIAVEDCTSIDSQQLYCFVSLLLTEWDEPWGEFTGIESGFNSLRPELAAEYSAFLIRQELGLVETKIQNVAGMAGYRDIPQYLKSVKDISEKIILLEEVEGRADKLKLSLDKYHDAYNFVGLYYAFSKLKAQKVVEKNLRLFLLFLLGFAALAPFVVKGWLLLSDGAHAVSLGQLSEKGLNSLEVPLLVTFAGFEILVLYFFKVVLHSLRSVRGQLLQLDLRMALCQFIDKYVEYSNDNKEKSGEALGKFESVVFSGLVTIEEKIPSTFDGMDVLHEVVKKISR